MSRTLPLVGPGPGWAPRETFSPSAIATARDCKRKWAYRYLLGIRTQGRHKSTILGSLIHAALEANFKGGTVYDLTIDPEIKRDLETLTEPEREELIREAPRRALAGLHLLPRLDDPLLEETCLEGAIRVDTTQVYPERPHDPIKLIGRWDLAARRAGVWYLYDHKSTRGKPRDPWAYCHTPETLAEDEQAIIYGLDLFQRFTATEELWIRWPYYLTDPNAHPQAHAVDARLTRAHVYRRASAIVAIADELRWWMRRRPKTDADFGKEFRPRALPPDPESPCEKYGGCPYRADRGGPCRVPLENVGARIWAAPEKKDNKMQTQATPPAGYPAPPPGMAWQQTPDGNWTLGAPPPAAPPNPLQPPETATAPAAAPPQPVEAGAEAAAEKPKRGRKPKTELPKAIEELANAMLQNNLAVVRLHDNGTIAEIHRR